MRHPLKAVIVLALLGAAGCGGGSAASTATHRAASPSTTVAAADAAPAPRCRAVPRTTVRMIASHGGSQTRFAARAAAAVDAGSGYAVSAVAVTGARRRMATWFVDKLRTPGTVTSGNVQALQVTNWPLEPLDPERVRQSQLCATKKLRGGGRVAP